MKSRDGRNFYIIFILLTASVYCLPLGLFMADTRFSNLYILYIGNFLFLATILSSVVFLL